MTEAAAPTIDSTSQQATVLKLFEHERRIAVTEKDIETISTTVQGALKEVYALPATIRDLIDARIKEVTTDANVKFDKLTNQVGKITWYALGGMIALVVDVVVHFLPKF